MLLCRSIFQLVSHVQHLLQPENLQYTLSSSRPNLFTASNLRTSYTVLSLTSPEITHFELEDPSAFESLTFVLAGTTSSNRSASACVLPWPPSRLADLQRTSLDHRYPLPSSFGCKKMRKDFQMIQQHLNSVQHQDANYSLKENYCLTVPVCGICRDSCLKWIGTSFSTG